MSNVDNYLHGLSQMKYNFRSNRDVPAWSLVSQSDRDHVAVLDGLALLLVFFPKGDVAATACWQTADECKLFWAKNEPVDDPKQLQYIENLLKDVKNGAKTNDLLLMVIDMCKEKIFHRVRKLAKSFGVSQSNQRANDHNLWQFDETKAPHRHLEAKLRTYNGFLKKPTVEVLDSFTRRIGRITKTSESTDFRKILYFSWFVTSVANLNEILEDAQVRYLAKLGDYMRILRRLPTLLQKARNSDIIIEQVSLLSSPLVLFKTFSL